MTEQVGGAGSTNTDTSTESGQVETGTPDASVVEPGGGQPSQGEATGSQGGQQTAQKLEGQESTVPDSYSFDMPEGVEVDQALVDAVTPVMKELGLNQEQASKLVEAYSEAASQGSTDMIAQSQQNWEQELKDDPEFGGDNFDENAAQVSQWVDAIAPDSIKNDLFDVFRSTGLGSNPAVVKFMHHLSKQFPTGEDSPTGGRAQRSRSKSQEERLYGTE